MSSPITPPDRDLAVVGGGIVGLALARELSNRQPGLRITVFERETEVGQHQTSHNSGVIHAGIYYKPGSLKAELCVDGVRRMYDFCERHGVPFERCGKVIVATEAAELPGLDELERRGNANGGGSVPARSRRSSRTPPASPRCTRRTRGSSTSAPSPARSRAS
jgi:L-2-hydroxyglutarate oxidase LhgO